MTDDNQEQIATEVSNSSIPASTFAEPEVPITAPEASPVKVAMTQGESSFAEATKDMDEKGGVRLSSETSAKEGRAQIGDLNMESGLLREARKDNPGGERSEPPMSTNVLMDLLSRAREKIQFRKKAKLEKIMGMFDTMAKISNKDVQKLLRVSDVTAFRYFNILEKDGRIKQEGKTGHSVFYIKA